MPSTRACVASHLPRGSVALSCAGIALFGMIMLTLGCLRAPAQAAQANATLQLKQSQVTIFRDRWGMAHLYAAREEDGFFGLGYATAEDRLEQILLLYLGVKGELAAAFGAGVVGADKVGPVLGGEIPDTVASDLRVKKFQILEEARLNMSKIPAQYRLDLKAYIAGINRFMVDHPERKPAWAPVLEPALPLALFWQYTLEADAICPARLAAAQKLGYDPSPLTTSEASDAFAIGRSKTADGGIIFSSDSHHPWEVVGTLFYPWRMKAGSLNVQAFDVAGAAMFFFGHSNDFAWGWTEGPRYTGDCYRIPTLKGDPRAYLFDGKLQRMVVAPYRINVRGAAPVTGEFEYTRHNGVLSPVVERRGDDAYVVSSAYFDQVGIGNAELYEIAHARTHAEIKAALAQMDLYPANLILAGRDGTLLYIRPGRLPKRPDGVDVTLPLDGSTSRTAWTGFVSLSEAVQVENPLQDYVGNDNVSPDRMYATPIFDPAKYQAYYAFDPGQTNTRQLRMIELLENAHGISDKIAIQITMDEKVFGVDQWAGMFKALKLSGAWAKNTDPDLATFVAALESFDGVFSKESRGALYYMAFREELRSASHKVAGEVEGAVEAGRPLSPAQQRSVEDAVLAAYTSLRQGFGTINLVFGDVHRIGRGSDSFPVGGAAIDSSQDKRELNTFGAWVLEPSAAEAMRTMAFRPDARNPALLDAYCCQRVPFVVAFHPDGSLTSYSEVLPGVSDDPGSPHFGDQMRLASRVELRPNYFCLRDLERNAESRIDIVVTGASPRTAKTEVRDR
ncbi:MAG: penicillin acylase family protein [Candidatus Sulfotelmatobacter sp.]|jgi:acyl-homoserine-lactone acylase